VYDARLFCDPLNYQQMMSGKGMFCYIILGIHWVSSSVVSGSNV